MDTISKWLEAFVNSTAWEMTPPKAYGVFHLSFTFIGIALCLLIAWLLRKVSEKGNRIFLFSMGMFLILAEAYKQVFYYYHMEDHRYNFGIFPFHLCSIPMYLCLIMPFLKPGKILDAMYSFITTFGLLGGFMAFIEPSGIVHGHVTLTLHAFIWHMCLILIGFYLIMSGRFAKTWKDYGVAVIVFVILCGIALGINFSLWDVSNGDINMFFVGPRESSLIVFDQISKNFGWYVSTILYIPTVCVGAMIVFLPVHFYVKKKSKKAVVPENETVDQSKNNE